MQNYNKKFNKILICKKLLKKAKRLLYIKFIEKYLPGSQNIQLKSISVSVTSQKIKFIIFVKKMYYLCIMKNENDMETILLEHNFIKGENPNEYIRDIWTIRIDDDYLEAFNSPTEDEIFPVYVKIHKERINDLLEDINEFSR